MRLRYPLTLLGVALIVLGLVERGWYFLAAWLGVNFLILGIAHFRDLHRVFGKRADGSLPPGSWLLFLPLLVYTLVIGHLFRLCTREPACNVITERLVVGRRLLPSELDETFASYVDLTAEFAEPAAIRQASCYCSFPILDGTAPSPERLRDAIAGLRPGKVFVHCAQGHGRTGLFALAVMLDSGLVRDLGEGLRVLSEVRPAIRLNRDQYRCIEAFAKALG